MRAWSGAGGGPTSPRRGRTRGRTRVWVVRVLVGLAVLAVLRQVFAPRPLRFIPAPGVTSGCGHATYQPGSLTYALSSGGMMRTYLLHVPPGYNPDRPTPLVVNFHGFAMSGALEERYTAMSALADRARFVVVYPDGSPQRGSLSWLFPLRGWNSATGDPFQGDDLRFSDELLTLLTRQLCLDPQRIYVTGLSNGGGMAYRLACADAQRIAAVATVAGAFWRLPGGCHPARPVPVLAIQGTADTVVPYHGGGSGAMAVPSTPAWAAAWAQRNACRPEPTTRALAPDVVQTRYEGCRDGAQVVVDAVLGGGHTWPGAHDRTVNIGRTATDFDASQAIWSFFQQSRV